MIIGVVLRGGTFASMAKGHLSGGARAKIFDSRDLAALEWWRKRATTLRVFVVGLPAEMPNLIKRVPKSFQVVPCAVSRWTGPGLKGAATALAGAMRRAPVDFLVLATGDPLDETLTLAGALSVLSDRPVFPAVAVTQITGPRRIRVTIWTECGYDPGLAEVPAILVMKCGSFGGDRSLGLNLAGRDVPCIITTSREGWWAEFLASVRRPAPFPWSPLAPLYGTVDRHIWVWGETEANVARLTTHTRQLIAEARRLAEPTGTAVVLATSRLPTADPGEPFIEGADTIVEVPCSSDGPRRWTDLLEKQWRDARPGLILLPSTLTGQVLSGVLAARESTGEVTRVGEGSLWPMAADRIYAVRGRHKDVPLVLVVSPDVFSEYDGCYHRNGRVVPLTKDDRGYRVPVIARHMDARAYYHLYGYDAVFISLSTRLRAVRRKWAVFDGPAVRFVGADEVDLAMKSRIGMAMGVSEATCLSGIRRRLGRLIAVNENARAPIVQQADVALIGSEAWITDMLAARWSEVMEQINLATRVLSGDY